MVDDNDSDGEFDELLEWRRGQPERDRKRRCWDRKRRLEQDDNDSDDELDELLERWRQGQPERDRKRLLQKEEDKRVDRMLREMERRRKKRR
jgi:hypothetical protein